MIKKILILTIILSTIIIGCGLLPMSEGLYNFKISKTLVLEDFEENDGFISTLYPWVIKGNGIKLRIDENSYYDGAYSGIYYLELSDTGSINLEIEASENQFLSFYAKTGYDTNFTLTINSTNYPITRDSYSYSSWSFFQRPLEKGSNRIGWNIDDRWDSVELDYIKVGNYYHSSEVIDFETDQSRFESNSSFVFDDENSPKISTTRANSGSRSLSLATAKTILLLKTTEAKTLSFYYFKESSNDLAIIINDSELNDSNTYNSWIQFTYSLSPGTHSLQLQKDYDYSSIYIDDIQLQ